MASEAGLLAPLLASVGLSHLAPRLVKKNIDLAAVARAARRIDRFASWPGDAAGPKRAEEGTGDG